MAESSSNEEVRLVLMAQTDDPDAIEALLNGVHGRLLWTRLGGGSTGSMCRWPTCGRSKIGCLRKPAGECPSKIATSPRPRAGMG